MGPVVIDGTIGGGQVVRTAIALSARTGVAVTLDGIRAGRPNPGLRPQHVAAIEAVAAACDAETTGVEVGARAVSFKPGPLRGDRVALDIGTAGSTTLVLQTLLAAAPGLTSPLTLDVRGGTDTKWAPTLVHAVEVLVDHARRLGIACDVLEAATGFYPKGGGRLKVRIHPPAPRAWPEDRGGLTGLDVVVRVSRLSDDIPTRLAKATARVLQRDGHKVRTRIDAVDALDAGVVVDAIARFQHATLGANALGEKGVRAETLGRACGEALRADIVAGATIDPHAADQVVPIIAGRPDVAFRVREVTGHLRTNIDVVRRFLPGAVVLDEHADHAILRGAATIDA